MLIGGILAMAALYIVASAIASRVPYLIGALIIGTAFTGLQRWLSSKDEKNTPIK